jgi:WD40 repeat protein
VSKAWIQKLLYSPDGKTLAIGSHDGNIYLLNVLNYSRR